LSKNRRRKKLKYKKIILISFIFSILCTTCYYRIYKINNHILVSDKILENSEKDIENDPQNDEEPQEDTFENFSQNKLKSGRNRKGQTEIILSSAGDCTIGYDNNLAYANSLPHVLSKHRNDYSYFFKNVSEIFKADDITTVNLETTFTNATAKARKKFTFKASPAYAKSLALGSIEGVNISNNHIHDYLDKGFKDTITSVKKEGINYFGEDNRWLTQVNGNKIAFLGYVAFNNDTTFLENIKSDINELKKHGYTVVINFHFGDENSYHPNNIQEHVAHYAIDHGADLIIGHHSHVIQGIEKYKNRIIAYSLGNFVFGGNANPKDKDTFILQTKFIFKNNKLTSYGIKAIPCSISSVDYINDYCPTPLKGDRRQRVFDKLNRLSMNLNFGLNDEFEFIDI
jgi:poly-gamma-glutamate synthesis protein (capsule biosynthesis protein)